MAIDLAQVAVDASVVLGSVGAFALWYKGYVIGEVRLAVNEQMVLKTEYQKDREAMWAEIGQIKKFDTEFAVLKNQVSHVQDATADVKNKVDNLTTRNDQRFDDLSRQLTGGLNRIAEIAGEIRARP